MKFSIVTIVFNGEHFIERTIDSVINQTYKNYEYIIIDGASIDATQSIVRKYNAEVDVFISEPDSGIYDAMNKGIKHCHGDYVIFMNGGDYFANKDVLFSVVNNISTDNDFIYGDSFIKTTKNEFLYKKARNNSYSWYGMFANHQAMIYKLDIITENNLLYDTSYTISADYKFTITFLKYCKFIKYVNKPICVFSLGGVSVLQRNLGLLESERARREVFLYSYYKNYLIRLLIRAARLLEDRISWLHQSLRYTEKH